MDRLIGSWESVNLHPSIHIYRCYGGGYRLLILEMNEQTRQTSVSEFEIEEEEEKYYFNNYRGEQRVTYDTRTDTICIGYMGDYNRN